MGIDHERDPASRMMNDATLRQMAAAKTTVNNENHMLRASSAGFILPSAARLRLSIRGLCAATSAISASRVRTLRHVADGTDAERKSI